VNSFELYLPEGPHSALAANGNLCTQKLLMPTLFTAQDGAQLKQSTKITVTGCPKVKAKKKTAKKKTKQKAKKASNARAGHQGGRS
jgi:glucose-6-phosphate 1-dehydrogenase